MKGKSPEYKIHVEMVGTIANFEIEWVTKVTYWVYEADYISEEMGRSVFVGITPSPQKKRKKKKVDII